MTDTSRGKTSGGLAFFLACSGCWSIATAGDFRSDEHPPLSLNLKDFQAFVQDLAAEANGSEAAMAKKLRALGFTCTPVSKSVQFECVRFGCRKWGGFLWQGALLQWSVNKYDSFPGKTGFDGAAINYSWVARCYPENGIEDAQKRFLSRQSPNQ